MKVKMLPLLVLFFFVLGTAVSQATPQDVRQLENTIQKKCEEQGVPNALTSLKSKKQSIEECVSKHSQNIESQMQDAAMTGSKGKMFATYCKIWPEVYNCMTPFTVIIRSCLTEMEQQAFDKNLDIVKDSLKYMCFKNGERIATFIDKGGMQCVAVQQKDIMKCVNSTYGGRPMRPSTTISPTTLTEEQCQDFNKFRRCINVQLKECDDPAPATIVDDLIQFWSKEVECPIINSAVRISKSILVTLVMFLLVKLY